MLVGILIPFGLASRAICLGTLLVIIAGNRIRRLPEGADPSGGNGTSAMGS